VIEEEFRILQILFKLQVGQLVVSYKRLSADSRTRNIDSCCVTCSLLCN